MSRKVLLIEDEPNIAEAIRFLLTREGWQVETHAEGTDALQIIQGANPDLLPIRHSATLNKQWVRPSMMV